MKRLLFILLILTACTKPEETIYEPTDPLVCVDCWDALTHLAFLDAFCGTELEADKFINEIKKSGNSAGMIIYCTKK